MKNKTMNYNFRLHCRRHFKIIYNDHQYLKSLLIANYIIISAIYFVVLISHCQ